MAAIERFVAEGHTGAMIYDALILACARKAKANRIYTLDSKHFRRIAPRPFDRHSGALKTLPRTEFAAPTPHYPHSWEP